MDPLSNSVLQRSAAAPRNGDAAQPSTGVGAYRNMSRMRGWRSVPGQMTAIRICGHLVRRGQQGRGVQCPITGGLQSLFTPKADSRSARRTKEPTHVQRPLRMRGVLAAACTRRWVSLLPAATQHALAASLLCLPCKPGTSTARHLDAAGGEK